MDTERIKRRGKLLVEAAELVESWDDDLREAVIEVLGDSGDLPTSKAKDFETVPCPICQKPLTVERKPTLHYRFAEGHDETLIPDPWPPRS
jgi:hypothetical protein